MKKIHFYKGYTIKHKSLISKQSIKWTVYCPDGALQCFHYTLPSAKEWVDGFEEKLNKKTKSELEEYFEMVNNFNRRMHTDMIKKIAGQ